MENRPSISQLLQRAVSGCPSVEAAGSNWMTWKTFQSSLSEDHGTAPGATFTSLGDEQGLEASPGERKVST